MRLHARLRRSPWIVSYWQGARLIYENYLSRVRISASPLCTLVLDFFDRWRDPRQLDSRLPGFSPVSIHRAIRELATRSFLESETRANPRSQAMEAWNVWSLAAGFYHFSTKDARYQVELPPPRAVRQHLRRHPRPPFFNNRYADSHTIQLPRSDGPAGSDFRRVLVERRTWREFSQQNLPLEALAQLLDLTWGVRRSIRIPILGDVPLKSSPSAGACHPIEAYVVSLRVRGLPQGLYHYAADRHVLECLCRAPMKRRTVRYLSGQTWFGEAAAVFLMTAVFPRSMWKYPHPRAYRAVLLDAGHLCQTLCLVATWLGLAPFCTMALAESLIEKDIGADGIRESAIYAAGVGVRPSKWRLLPEFPPL